MDLAHGMASSGRGRSAHGSGGLAQGGRSRPYLGPVADPRIRDGAGRKKKAATKQRVTEIRVITSILKLGRTWKPNGSQGEVQEVA